MSGELEDFLRRAAQRRAENAAARAERPQPPRRPQYTDRDRERVTTSSDFDEEIVVADLVQALPVDDPQERQRQRNQAVGEAAEAVRRKLQAKRSQSGSGQSSSGQSGSVQRSSGPGGLSQGGLGQSSTGQGPGMLGSMDRAAGEAEATPASVPALQALLRLMSDPDGIDQAILAREILDRPTHRWR